MIIKTTRGIKPSTKTLKDRKKIKRIDYCYKCGRVYHKYDLEIEHPIPVCIGGDPEDTKIICKYCHKEKTKFDILYSNFLKKIGMLIKTGPYTYESNGAVIEVYKLLRRNK